jgi:hypothetical protein
MVQRSKRSMSPDKAREMQAKLRAFHCDVRKWCGEIPIGTTVYVALDGLNSALMLADAQFNAAVDGARYERRAGERGLE